MIDVTEKPKISSKFAIRTARYNEFQCKFISCRYNSEVRAFKYLLKVLLVFPMTGTVYVLERSNKFSEWETFVTRPD